MAYIKSDYSFVHFKIHDGEYNPERVQLWVSYQDDQADQYANFILINDYLPLTDSSFDLLSMITPSITGYKDTLEARLRQWEEYAIPEDKNEDEGFWVEQDGVY